MDSRYGFGMGPSQLGRYPGSEVAAVSEIAPAHLPAGGHRDLACASVRACDNCY